MQVNLPPELEALCILLTDKGNRQIHNGAAPKKFDYPSMDGWLTDMHQMVKGWVSQHLCLCKFFPCYRCTCLNALMLAAVYSCRNVCLNYQTLFG